MSRGIAAVLLSHLALAAGAAAQAGWILDVEYGPGQTSVNPASPSCTLRVYAYFAPHDFAIAGARWEVRASEPGWASATLVPFCRNCIVEVYPRIEGSSIWTTNGQVHFPPVLPGNPENPILGLEAVWATQDFARRDVSLATFTSRFDVYPDPNSPSSQSRLSSLVEGQAVIRVTPSPPAFIGLAPLAFAFCARRRSSR
jgi:hypothetical protein